MNKQLIVELRRQAGDLGAKEIRIYDLSRDQMLDIFMEKFAEAIVRECTSVVNNLEGSDYIPWVGVAIKKHFGVEE